jgi:hypothetical protein
VVDSAAVIGAAARFLRAWRAATQGEKPLTRSDPAVMVAHAAARELIRATGSKNLVEAYAVVDELVHAIQVETPF